MPDANVPLKVRESYLPFGRPNFSDQEIDAVVRVMRSGWIGQGNETLAFEKELATAVSSPNIVAVSSCTSALTLSMRVLDIGPGDEVIVPSLTWCSTANAILYMGAKPVFCDVDANTMCATPEAILKHLSPRTRAVMVVHMGGLAANITAIRAALPANVAIVEDAAHALGATYADGTPVGSSGNLTCYSFYANKNLSTAEGGAIATADSAIADELRSLRLHALPADAWRRFINPNVTFDGGISALGYKMNYTDLQACIGRVQLARFGELQARRADVAIRYEQRLSGSGVASAQSDLTSAGHARHLYLLAMSLERLHRVGHTRNSLLMHLRKANIGVSVHYHPLHTMPLYTKEGHISLPVTESLADRLLTLPISASMDASDVDYVCEHLLAALK